MKLPIYLDYAATTPIDPRVISKMNESLRDSFGNASSKHHFGVLAKESIEKARQEVADLIGADASEIIFTSGATESNNLALKGIAENYKSKGQHILTLKTEHPSVLDACEHLEKKGFSVTYLATDNNGLLDLEKLIANLRKDTLLVSIMHVNNEIGVIQNIAEIAKITSARGILLHVDATQSVGKIQINLAEIPVDLLSFSAHKIYGPKGIGALYLRQKPRVRVAPLIDGGGQERGMRSGTLPTHQIVGMGTAFQIAKEETIKDQEKITALRDYFLKRIEKWKMVHVNAIPETIPNILNIRFDTSCIEEKLERLSKEVAISMGSACLSGGNQGSSVLRALGHSDREVKSTVRISLGRFTTIDQINEAIDRFEALGMHE